MGSKEIQIILLSQLLSIFLGICSLAFLSSTTLHFFYVLIASISLVIVPFCKKNGLVSPLSYFILSFFVFVWMRYLLHIFFSMSVISVGMGITDANLHLVAAYLGISANVIVIVSNLATCYFSEKPRMIFKQEYRIVVPKLIQYLILLCSLLAFGFFILDSVRKISIIRSSNYLMISETILLQGYRYFSIGKHLLLLWLIFGNYKNRFFIASSLLVVSSVGYLMRGARGYAIMYIFLWLLFFSLKRKIKLLPLVALGVALIVMANFILSYRLKGSVASGFGSILLSTLHSQGASVESVFGSVVFHDTIAKEFSFLELFTRNDYGIVVDRVRGTGFERGGFGSSFFGEIYLGGIALSFCFLTIAGICIGFLESAYNYIVKSKKASFYANLLLFMTVPNLVYLGRSSIKDFVMKCISTTVILLLLHTYTMYKEGRMMKTGGNKNG